MGPLLFFLIVVVYMIVLCMEIKHNWKWRFPKR